MRKYRNEVKMEEEYESSSEGEVEDLPTMMRKMRLALKEEKARSAKLEAKIEKLEKNIQNLEYRSCPCEIECDKLVDDCNKLNYECEDLDERLSALVGSIWPEVKALKKRCDKIEVKFYGLSDYVYGRLCVLEEKLGVVAEDPDDWSDWAEGR